MATGVATMVELDDRRRLSLGKIGRHSRYLVREERDGTLIFEPAIVLTEVEARVLGNDEIMTQLRNTENPASRHARRGPPPHTEG